MQQKHTHKAKTQSHNDNITFACEAVLVEFRLYVLFAPSEHTGVQRKTSAVAESFSQVQKSSQIPEGESVPDFEEKLRPITAQEGEVNHCFHLTAP